MAAIVTTPFRVLNAENFKEDVAAASNSIYLGIGKSDVWSTNTSDLTDTIPFTPGDHQDDLGEAWQQMIAMKLVSDSDISHVVPRYNYADGAADFVAWDSDDADIYDKKFYCLTSEFKVYKLLKVGPSTTSVQPTHTTVDPVTGGDGYTWKYMYTIITSDSEKFLTNSFMPVKTVSETANLATTDVNYPQQQSQISSRNSSTAAGIERLEVTAGGSNYDASDVFTVTISGDGTGATVVDAGVTVTGGAITAIALNAKGTDYTVADVTITHDNASGGTAGAGATARAVIAPQSGHGTDPVKELGAFYVSLNVQLDGNDGSDFTVGNDFRQITILKNPYSSGTTVATATTIKTMKHLEIANGQTTSNFVVDQLIVGSNSGAKAYLVEIATDDKLYYYQNSKTGYIPFQANDTVTGTLPSGGSTTLDDNSGAESGTDAHVRYDDTFVRGSGQMVFLENRDPISRALTQIEDIKCIIEF